MCMLHGVTMLQVRGDADLRFLEILPRKTDRMQHRAARRALVAIDDELRVLAVKAGAVNVFLGGGAFRSLAHKKGARE